MKRNSEALPSEPATPAPRLAALLGEVLRHPQQLFRLWNWKSALLSIILRGPIFFLAALRQGFEVAMASLLAESIFCAASAGFYGAIVQTLKDAEPQWITGVFLSVILPVFFQIIEYLIHWFRGTPHLRVAEIVSLFVGSISALFNWYAMRRGTLLVGRGQGGFGGDLRRLPRLFLGFVALLPRKLGAKSSPSPKLKVGISNAPNLQTKVAR